MRRPLVLLTLVALAAPAAAPAVAGASTTTERRAAAQAATRLTFTYAKARSAADPRARAAARARRASAARCLAVWRSAPKARIPALGELYFSSVAGARWAVDGPIVDAWIARLAASKPVMRVAPLAAAVRAMRRSTPVLTAALNSFPNTCAVVTAWQEAGWDPDAAPEPLPELQAASDALESADRTIDAGRALIRRYGGPSGANAADLFGAALDEPDGQVVDSCDPVARIVLPDNVEACDER